MNKYFPRLSLLSVLVFSGVAHGFTPYKPPQFYKLSNLQSLVKPDISAVSYRDLAYADDSPRQKLDIYLPQNSKRIPFPAVILIHNNIQGVGDKDEEAKKATWLSQNGFTAVSINYRLSDEAGILSAVHDVKAAVRHVRANAEDYLIDPKRIAVWGTGDGGVLAMLMGTSNGDMLMEGQVGNDLSQSSDISVAVNLFGAADLSQLSGLVNLTSTGHKALPDNISPYLSDDDAAMFIQDGTKNKSFDVNKAFAKQLEGVIGKADVTFTMLNDADYNGAAFFSKRNMNRVLMFLRKHINR